MRPVADAFEARFPALAAFAARLLAQAPASIRRRVLADAFDRAAAAFNRGDLAVVFALFAPDVEYVPPPPVHQGAPIYGRDAVRSFWEKTLAQFDENGITNLSIEETAPSRFVRTAELHHKGSQQELRYTIRQTTELRRGRVARQINEVL
jgi:ketosteroid isomerase-like protein